MKIHICLFVFDKLVCVTHLYVLLTDIQRSPSQLVACQPVMNSRNQKCFKHDLFWHLKCQNIPQVSMVTVLFSIYTAAHVQLCFCSYFGTTRTKCHSPLKLKALLFFYFFNNAEPNWEKTHTHTHKRRAL